jgi:hypothetical protein
MPDESVPFPYGVADAAGRRAFIADGAGGILALDLADGHVLWRSDAAERPLLLVDDRLVALKRRKPSAFEVVVLDVAASARPILATAPIALPEWVVVGVADNDRFSLAPRIDATGRLELAWSAHAWYEGGAAPSSQVMRESERSAEGVVRVDLASGSVEQSGSGGAPQTGDSHPEDEPGIAGAAIGGALAAHVVANRIYSVVDAGGRLALRAADRDTARTFWEVPLTATPSSPPRRRQ